MHDASKRLRDDEESVATTEWSEVNLPSPTPEIRFKPVNSRITIPDGMTVDQWSMTLCKMEKVTTKWNSKGLSYRALIERAKYDTEVSGYLTWCRNAWGTKGTGILNKKKVTPANDLAMFLECIDWVPADNSSSSASFVREFAG